MASSTPGSDPRATRPIEMPTALENHAMVRASIYNTPPIFHRTNGRAIKIRFSYLCIADKLRSKFSNCSLTRQIVNKIPYSDTSQAIHTV